LGDENTVTTPDLVNGVFEAFGSLGVWGNVLALIKDKQVKGTRWWFAAFFTSWGFWNLYYYPHLGQWLSFWGGASMALANLVWVVLAIKYCCSTK
jgi:hypothetical protein